MKRIGSKVALLAQGGSGNHATVMSVMIQRWDRMRDELLPAHGTKNGAFILWQAYGAAFANVCKLTLKAAV